DGINELALPKGVQRDPLKGFLQHVDLLLVRRGEQVTVELPITVVGDVVPDGLLEQQLVAVSVTAEATHIPESVEVNVEGMEIGTQLTAGQIQLPQGVELAEDPEALVLHVVPKPTVAEPEAAEGEEGEAASAE